MIEQLLVSIYILFFNWIKNLFFLISAWTHNTTIFLIHILITSRFLSYTYLTLDVTTNSTIVFILPHFLSFILLVSGLTSDIVLFLGVGIY